MATQNSLPTEASLQKMKGRGKDFSKQKRLKKFTTLDLPYKVAL